MCGIAGIIGGQLPASELTAGLERMRLALRNRGPDDTGTYLSPVNGAALAHTRLAILDLTAAGHQPMLSRDGRHVIVFNGEIYNHAALRQELEAAGERFESRSDTEVILAMYRRHGPACVHELEGMFAFCIWDEFERTAFLARDPFGIKPFYYHAAGGTLAFASEVRALLASGLMPRRPCREAVFSYWLFGTVQAPLTIVEDIHCLPAGHYARWSNGELQLRRYWEPQILGEGITDENAVSATRAALVESVQRHLVSDVPVGIFLSGGADSTALAALAKKARAGEIQTFCISFDDPALSEGGAAARTAQHLGTRHHEWKMDAPTGRALLADFLQASDQPSIDGFNTYCVSRFARDRGLKVVLSGLGGDELFGGYGSFQLVPRLVRAGRRASLVPFAPVLVGRALEALAISPRMNRLGHYLTDRPSEAGAYWCGRGIFTPAEATQLVHHFLGGSGEPNQDESRHFVVPRQPSLEDTVSYLELTRYMRNQLLRDSDVMSMASGLELRVPFVDRKLFEVLRQIPAVTRLAPGKALLLRAVPEIPGWVAQAPKRGFVFPFEQWIAAEWGGVFQRLKDTSPVPLRTWYQCWCVHALEQCLTRLGLR
ncbi:MAG: asparagine synthase (glutamine-hydrolyzing) [Limisphaerales bacterium]